MSPSTSSSNSSGTSKGKGKEFTSSLCTIDSEAPVSPSHGATTWDAETDHLLSYFLAGDGDGPNPTGHPLPDFASSKGSSPTDTEATTENAHSVPANASKHKKEYESNHENIPATPAMNFYAPSSSYIPSSSSLSSSSYAQTYQSRPHLAYGTNQFPMPSGSGSDPRAMATNSNLSSSMSSMAASLVSGGPILQKQMKQPQTSPGQPPLHPLQTYPFAQAPLSYQAFAPSSMEEGSPISPAAMIGHGQENLLLPGSNTSGMFPSMSVTHTTTVDNPTISDHERHLNWLQELNAMAKAANGGPVPPSYAVMSQGSTRMYPLHAAAAMMTASQEMVKPAAESAEKRAKRLERNRESARKSRRRKKERLYAIETLVNKRHGELDVERRRQINLMVSSFRKRRQDVTEEDVLQVLSATGCDSEIVQNILEFQHTALKQLVLPTYHRVLLWFNVHDESFYHVGKEQYADDSNLSKSSTAKISSKQIGDELTNGTKELDGSTKKRMSTQDRRRACEPNLIPFANDAARVWPLFCYEFSFSVDQEERFVATHKSLEEKEATLREERAQLNAAAMTTDSLRDTISTLSGAVAARESKSISLLSQKQTMLFRNWATANKNRCCTATAHATILSTESSLSEICRRLNEVIISKNEKCP